VRWGAIAAALALLACHSDPYGDNFYGARGTLTSGAEVRLTYADTNEDGVPFRAYAPSWAANGAGILFSYSPRVYQSNEKKLGVRCIRNIPCRPVAEDPGDQCLAMLPPTGGSAFWDVCETRSGHSNVVDRIVTGDVLPSGQLIYVEEEGPASQQFAPDGPPGEYGDLWNALVGTPVVRRELCRLYSRDTVLSEAPSCGVVDLRDMHWTSTSAFVALSGTSLIRGVITSVGATLTRVPSAANVANAALVANGTAAIVVGGDLTVRRVNLVDGTVVVVATLPDSAGNALLDIGCHPDVCVVLANGGGTRGGSSLWRVDLATGAVTLARAFDHNIAAAKLSPVSGDVVALEGVNLYLLTGVLL
jgi:hypothetical protein